MTKNKLTPTLLDHDVWAACPYVRQWIDEPRGKRPKCKKCPSYYIDVDHGKMQRMCRSAVEEILEPALEAYPDE